MKNKSENYFVKFIPIQNNNIVIIEPKQFILSNTNENWYTKDSVYRIESIENDVVNFSNGLSISTGGFWHMIEKNKYQFVEPILITNNEPIKVGDTVLIEFTDGENTTGDYIKGILTKKYPDDDPYCEVDNKEIMLASEGHSSITYKVFASINLNYE